MKQQLLRNTLVMLAAAGMAAIPGKAFAHQVQTNYILNGQFGSPSSDLANGALQNASQNAALSEELSEGPSEGVASLELQSTFSNGQPLKGASVTVYSPEQPNRVWAKGLTDSQGRYTFKPDQTISGNWEVNIKRAGHQDIITVPVSESGIEPDLMAQGDEIKDIHYASSPLMAVGSLAIAAASIGFARYSSKKSAE